MEFIIPFSAGGTTDTIGRLVARELGAIWNQPTVVQNKGGGSGIIATKYVQRANPDGYTLLVALDSSQVTAGLLSPPPPYDPVTDFSIIGQLVEGAFILIVNQSLGVNSVKDLVDYARANPGKLNSSSAAIGSTPHLLVESFKAAAGVDIVHVPYLGAAPAALALRTGEVQMSFVAATEGVPLATGNPNLKALAIMSDKRLSALPNVPTIIEAGYPAVQDTSRFGLIGPPGMNPALIEKINADTRRALDTPATRRRLAELGFTLSLTSPKDYAANLVTATKSKQKIIDTAKIKVTN